MHYYIDAIKSTFANCSCGDIPVELLRVGVLSTCRPAQRPLMVRILKAIVARVGASFIEKFRTGAIDLAKRNL